MRLSIGIAALSLLLAVTAGCKNDTETIQIVIPEEVPDFPFDELQPEQIAFTNAELIYFGDKDYTLVSDLYQLSFWTDMPIDETGNPVGPGKLLRVSLNAPLLTGSAAPMLPPGTYTEPESSWSYNPFTFIEGYMQTVFLPTGDIEIPVYSFFGELAVGQTGYTPDLLREGYCRVQVLDNGDYAVSGILVGHSFTKRVFTYTGPIETIDRSEGDTQDGNSTLTADLQIGSLTQARLKDLGNYYYLPADDGSGKPNATSYRALLLQLAESGVNIDGDTPADTGKVLQVEILVPYETEVQDGIPAGSYRVVARAEGGGVNRSDIVPGNIIAGVYDGAFKGSWYRRYAADALQDFASIESGTLTVAKTGGSHRFEFDFTDDTEARHRIYGSCTITL